MSAIYKILLLNFSLLLTISLDAQFWEYGVDPASLKWKQINTPHFRLIFPDDFSPKANDLANTLEKYYRPNSVLMNHFPSIIPVIIHNQTVHSNAFVAPAPRRMELFTFPDPRLYAVDWLTELSIHEFRHAIHLDKLEKGPTRFISYILGEQAIGLSAAMLPFWFLEGDAVTAETKLTNSGRGRLPSFEMDLKAQLLSDPKPYSFNKAYLGSYRDYVPDYYTYGYQLVNYARTNYGNNYWPGANEFVGRKPFLIFPLHFYTKSVTGHGNGRLYQNTMNFLKQHWEKSTPERISEGKVISGKKKVFTSYQSPEFLHDSSIVAVKTGLNIIPQVVKFDHTGKETKLFTPGRFVSGNLSSRGSKILWDEVAVDPRWSNRSWSVLKEYDLSTGRIKRLTRRTRYSSAEYSVSGDSIAAVETTPDYGSYLVVLSAAGNVLQRIQYPGEEHLQDPVWTRDGIAVITTGDKGKEIMLFNLLKNEWNKIFDAGFHNISGLKSNSGFLYFNGSFEGTDNIYSLDLLTKELSKLSDSAFGSFDPSVSSDNSKVVYSDYSNNGYKLVTDRINHKAFRIPADNDEQPFFRTNDSILPVPADTLYEKYPEKKYSKAAHLFKFHSWSPFYFDYNDPGIDDPPVSPGFTLLSQNHLGTALTSLAWEYRDKTNFFHLNHTYKGLYPVFEISSTFGGRPYYSRTDTSSLPAMGTNMFYSVNTYIPLSFNTGKFITGLRPSLMLSSNSSYYYYPSDDRYKRGFIILQPGLYFYSYLRASSRDIQPSLGLTLNLENVNAPAEDELFGSVTSLSSTIYLPGILKDHGLKFRGEWQEQKIDRYFFHNIINPPRGYELLPSAINMGKYSIDYVLPLLYPDLSLGPLLYLKRIRATLFNDHVNGSFYINGKSLNETFNSRGVEVFADYHLMRIILEISSGIRVSWLSHEQKINARFLVTINLDKY